jgi:aldehyde dehydrogenase (NAD+)
MSGQGCAYPTRMLVQQSIYKEVCDRMVAAAAHIQVGDPFDPETQSGPVINEAAVERILGMIDRAKTGKSGRLLIGGSRLGGALANGYFIAPTIFADVDPTCELAQQEVFGPVLAIMPFDDEKEAIRIANSTSYGLSAYIQSNDITRVHRVAGELQAGAVLINGCSNIQPSRPFGGMGLSGYGREGGREGLEEFQRLKSVAIS